MKSICLTFLAIGISLTSLKAQKTLGDWHGKISIQGMNLRVGFHVMKSDTADFAATMDSPDQGAFGIPMTNAIPSDDSLIVEHNGVGMIFKGALVNDSTINGILSQAGMNMELVLTRAEQGELKAPERPQEPKAPFNYEIEEVTFKNKKANITLAGTLTKPKTEGPHPVVVMITGSGPQDRDETILRHKPFWVIADYLTKKGVAVLRYDDRGTAESEGEFEKATSVDFANDAQAAVEYLTTRKDMDSKNIGLIGHSEGGLIAPLVATESKDVAFIVLLAGPGIQCSELMLLQQGLIYEAVGEDPEMIQKSYKRGSNIFKLINEERDLKILRLKLADYMAQVMDEDEKEIPEGKSKQDLIDEEVASLTAPWMLYFLRYNPEPTLKKVTCPVLALNGEKDLQVTASENLTGIRNALEAGGNKNFKIISYPGLNHLFQHCETGAPTEYGDIEETFSEDVLKDMTNWIKEIVK